MKITSLASESTDFLPQVEPTPVPQRSGEDIPARDPAQTLTRDESQPLHPEKAEDISLQKLQNVTEAMDSYMASMGVSLKFNIDERTDTVQVEVRDPETDKLIRKIPADEMLDLAASIEKMMGLFLDRTL